MALAEPPPILLDEQRRQGRWALVRMSHGITRRRIAGQLSWFAIWLVLSLVALWLRPDPSGHGTHTQLGLPPCPSVLLWNKPCLACGLTTSFSATVHGKLASAFAAHPFGPVLYGLFTVSAMLALWGWVRVRRFEITGFGNWLLVSLVVLYVAYGVARFAVSAPISSSSPLQNGKAGMSPR